MSSARARPASFPRRKPTPSACPRRPPAPPGFRFVLLRGASRIDEHRAVLGEIAEVAERERADLVQVVGGLYETAAPSPEPTAAVPAAWVALPQTGPPRNQPGAAPAAVRKLGDHEALVEALREPGGQVAIL